MFVFTIAVVQGASVPLSTDQVAALIELSRQGSLRAAARVLHITEQGVRNRLLALEARLGTALYRKVRGPRRSAVLTPQGQRLLPYAMQFLDRAQAMAELFSSTTGPSEIHVAATQYLILYVLIDVVRRFHRRYPTIRVRLSNYTEQEVEDTLLRTPDTALGVAAPYELPAGLEYVHLFSLEWRLITPPNHPLLRRKQLSLSDLVDLPLILFERGSTGRQHVIDAFQERGLSPRTAMETTNTEIIVRMVEAGLGVSVVPLMPGGRVTRGRRVASRPLTERIRPIRSGILLRRGEPLAPAARAFVDFLTSSMRVEQVR